MKEECVVCAEEFDVPDKDTAEEKTGKPVCPNCKVEEGEA